MDANDVYETAEVEETAKITFEDEADQISSSSYEMMEDGVSPYIVLSSST